MKSLQKIKFGDLYLIPSRNGLSRPERVRGSGFKMINMGEIFQYDRISDIPMELVPMSHREVVDMCVEEGDLLFARQSLVLSGAGKASIVTRVQEKTTFESHIIRVRLDRNKAEPLFYYYYFKSPYSGMRAIVQQCAQSGIRGSDLQKLLVSYPKLETQKGIADIIDQYDQLFDTNHRRIQLLEESARLLFYEWFVYFRFLGHEKVKIVDDVPAGWKTSTIKDCIYFISRGPSLDYISEGEDDGVPVLNQRCIRNGEIELDSVEYAKELSLRQHDLYLKEFDILINSMGEGTLGRVSRNLSIKYPMIIHNCITVVRANENIINQTILFYRLREAQTYLEIMGLGSTGQTSLKTEVIERIKILIPPEELRKQFDSIVKPLWLEVGALKIQNQKLAQARDLLLPRLMSGAIEV